MTQEAAALLARLVPPYGSSTLAELVPAIAAALGHPLRETPLPDTPSRTPSLQLPAVRRVCLLLVDGLGQLLLDQHADLAPTLTGHHVQRRSLMTGFPSTTPASLAMLGTGLPPGQHGLVGYRVFEPGLPVDPPGVLNVLEWHDSLDGRSYQPVPTLFERLEQDGVGVVTVGPRAFRGTGLTVAALRGGRHVGGDSLGELVAGASAALAGGTGHDATLVYAYLSDLDGTGHRVGVDSDAWREQLWFVDQLVARLRRAMPADSLLLVTGDHGMVDVPRDRRVDLAELPELWRGVEAIAGEPRATTLRLVAGESAQQVAATWNARLGPDFLALPMTAAAELYGGLSATAARRAGDVLVLAVAEDVALIDSRHRSTKASWLHGMHGGLTDAERIVPLCLVTP